MAPNSSARSAFATLFAAHVSNGTRPNTATGEPWTYAELAGEVIYSDEESPVTENTISNWYNGRTLPRQIEPLLRALFGTEKNELHAKAREQLRDAFKAARAERLSPAGAASAELTSVVPVAPISVDPSEPMSVAPAELLERPADDGGQMALDQGTRPTEQGMSRADLSACDESDVPDAARSLPKSRATTLLLGGLFVLLVIWAAAWLVLGEGPIISKVRVYDDDHYRTGPSGDRTLTELHPKSQYYQITSPDEFFMAIGLVISGYRKSAAGDVKLDLIFTGLPKKPSPAWQIHYKFTRESDWEGKLIPARVGKQTVLGEFGLKEGAAIPMIAAVQCAQASALERWTGEIEIEIDDSFGFFTRSAHDSITFDLGKPTRIAETPLPSSCPKTG